MIIRHKHDVVGVIFVGFNNRNTGLVTMLSDIIAQQQYWVPIQKCEVFLMIGLNFCLEHLQYKKYNQLLGRY